MHPTLHDVAPVVARRAVRASSAGMWRQHYKMAPRAEVPALCNINGLRWLSAISARIVNKKLFGRLAPLMPRRHV